MMSRFYPSAPTLGNHVCRLAETATLRNPPDDFTRIVPRIVAGFNPLSHEVSVILSSHAPTEAGFPGGEDATDGAGATTFGSAISTDGGTDEPLAAGGTLPGAGGGTEGDEATTEGGANSVPGGEEAASAGTNAPSGMQNGVFFQVPGRRSSG